VSKVLLSLLELSGLQHDSGFGPSASRIYILWVL